MSIEAELSGDTYTIYIEGDFTFNYLDMFKKVTNNADILSAKNISVDFRKAQTIDSSALGMLLNMNESYAKEGVSIKLINCNDFISNIFKITNFSKKFTIE